MGESNQGRVHNFAYTWFQKPALVRRVRSRPPSSFVCLTSKVFLDEVSLGVSWYSSTIEYIFVMFLNDFDFAHVFLGKRIKIIYFLILYFLFRFNFFCSLQCFFVDFQCFLFSSLKFFYPLGSEFSHLGQKLATWIRI